MYILAPSLLAADFTILGEQIREIQKAGVNYLHIDVMDGMFKTLRNVVRMASHSI